MRLDYLMNSAQPNPQNQSIIKRILNLQPYLILLLQHLLKPFQLLTQQIINLHLLLNQRLQLIHIRIDIVIDVPIALYFGDQLALLG